MGLKHVEDTTSNALKKSLLEMLAKYELSVARLREQGYDGASNMRGEFNGLQNKFEMRTRMLSMFTALPTNCSWSLFLLHPVVHLLMISSIMWV